MFQQRIRKISRRFHFTPVFFLCRSAIESIWRSQSTGRNVRQRPAVAQPRPGQDHRVGPARDQTLRHFASAEGLPRLRVQDIGPVQRDRLHLARRHRRLQAQGHHAKSGRVHQGVEDERPGHFRLGNPGQTLSRRGLRQIQRSFGFFHQQNFEE